MRNGYLKLFAWSLLAVFSCSRIEKSMDIPSNTWTLVSKDEKGARRHSSFRYVENGGYFLLWGFLGFVTEYYGNPEVPWEDNPEYDIVVFDPKVRRWQSQFPFEKEKEWGDSLPPMHLCSCYQGITIGSHRPQLKMREGVLRPDLNLVFDQVTYDSRRSRMVYFTGGRTFAYDAVKREWSDIAGAESPPPVLGGSLCYDQFNDEIVLFGGGHVAETGPDGNPVGYTGTWIYECKSGRWSRLPDGPGPGPRIASRLVCDSKNKLLVVFGGDCLTHYLADTWIYDTRTRKWRASEADGGPPARAGHFTVYDPRSGWIIIGGGYNRQDLNDMWAYDAAKDRWLKLKSDVPFGWYVTADIKPDESLILLTTSAKPENDRMSCNEIYSVRTTYAFQMEKKGLVDNSVTPAPQDKILKRSMEEAVSGTKPDPTRRKAQLERLNNLPENEWVLLSDPGRVAPLRTWGSCSFDTDKSRIVYWGGGHCGYGGNDYDFYDVEENTWISSPLIVELPERNWDKSGGVYPAGLAFSGAPWMRHGRKAYAYDPVSKKMINMKYIFLTAGYEPEFLKNFYPVNPDFGSGENFKFSGYSKWVTWTYEPDAEKWELLCPCNPGLDLMVTTPRGVMAVDYNWGAAGSLNRPDTVRYKGEKVVENAVFLLDVAGHSWKKLSAPVGPWPQNLYELTALVYDSNRDRLLLHGGGAERNELWTYKFSSSRWEKNNPVVKAPRGAKPPVCGREGVYIPGQDVFFTCGYPPGKMNEAGVYVFRVSENAWYRVNITLPPGRTVRDLLGQNRAIAYDPKHDLVLMVLGERSGDFTNAVVYALRYNHSRAVRGKS